MYTYLFTLAQSRLFLIPTLDGFPQGQLELRSLVGDTFYLDEQAASIHELSPDQAHAYRTAQANQTVEKIAHGVSAFFQGLGSLSRAYQKRERDYLESAYAVGLTEAEAMQLLSARGQAQLQRIVSDLSNSTRTTIHALLPVDNSLPALDITLVAALMGQSVEDLQTDPEARLQGWLRLLHDGNVLAETILATREDNEGYQIAANIASILEQNGVPSRDWIDFLNRLATLKNNDEEAD